MSITGRHRGTMFGHSIPSNAALCRGVRFSRPSPDGLTVLSIGAWGFSVIEVSKARPDLYRQNSRCAQGTGRFLTQLVERFGLDIEDAGRMCASVPDPLPLSGRCPVILKSDLTHLANSGEDKFRILAGLYDAISENALSLLGSANVPPDLLLIGGVAQSPRIQLKISEWLCDRGMRLLPTRAEDDFLEAIGAALNAIEDPNAALTHQDGRLLRSSASTRRFERVPALASSMHLVTRMPKPIAPNVGTQDRVYLGLDIGSTGAKAVAIRADRGSAIWETYLDTMGAPLAAAKGLLKRFDSELGESTKVVGLGVTGSGREVVGSLLRVCYGEARVFVLNEIAAHARGATSFDPAVDTIFEIGGQDAKYIRLDHGQIVDAAMNEACSAGTGSFIAEQGTTLGERELTAADLSRYAMQADHGIVLGQHCSVFIAEIVNEAVAAGEQRSAIIAGLYDSVVQNYLNRVKRGRSIGRRIFCQGMPFTSDALAAAVARQTGCRVVVPPSPGMIGALGIALLIRDQRNKELESATALQLDGFHSAVLQSKASIVCQSTRGCGGSGQKCRINRLTTTIGKQEEQFLWGGACSLHDKSAARKKLPNGTPDPWKRRDALLDRIIESATASEGSPVVAFPDQLAIKDYAPLLLAFLDNLGFRCRILRHSANETLRRGREGSGLSHCAPMQLYQGAYFELCDDEPDYLLLPTFKGLARIAGEEFAKPCPIVIASADLISNLLSQSSIKLLRPVIDFDRDGYRGETLRSALYELACTINRQHRFESALCSAIAVQERFELECRTIGTETLEYCRANDLAPIVVLGHSYTIYNDLLNSNVPTLLRTLGAVAIPVDCLPIDDASPCYRQQYWSHVQRNLRAAEQVRRTKGLYAVVCSNYACGPDSFGLEFIAYTMSGKPFAVIETDGHSGDTGTKTRLEAFLFCVDLDRAGQRSRRVPTNDFAQIEERRWTFARAKERGDIILLSRMGPQTDLVNAALRSEGLSTEALPEPTHAEIVTGQQNTNGKECFPLMLTLGALINRIARDCSSTQTYAFFMPTTNGPCRFGVYNSQFRLTLERLGLGHRVRTISPSHVNYFDGLSADLTARIWIALLVYDALHAMRLFVRPEERAPGLAERLFWEYFDELVHLIGNTRPGSPYVAMRELFGKMWGMRDLVRRAARSFRSARGLSLHVPTVAVVGEVYVRLDSFANNRLIERLEKLGLRVYMPPSVEWLEYVNQIELQRMTHQGSKDYKELPSRLAVDMVQRITLQVLHDICRRELGWGVRTRIEEVMSAGARYVNPALTGEAVLTVGGPINEYERGHIDGVIIVGPHECMPCKIAEAHFVKIGRDLGLPSLSLSVTSEGFDGDAIERFAFDLHDRFRNDRNLDTRHTSGIQAKRVGTRVRSRGDVNV